MTKVSDIESAWRDKIWNADEIVAITERVLTYEFTDTSETETEPLYFNERINFFEVVTQDSIMEWVKTDSGTVRKAYNVEVRYTLEKDPEGGAWTEAREAMATLISLVASALGPSWSNTVDFYSHQNTPVNITSAIVAGKPCYRAIFRFIGYGDATP